MKIIHIAPINDKVSGISNSVRNLVEAQSEYVESIAVISSQSNSVTFSEKISVFNISKDNFHEIIFGKSFKKITNIFGKPDIVVFHDIYNLKQSFFFISILKKNIDIYITPRGAFSPVALKRSSIKKKLYYLLLVRPFLNYIRAFIALNKNELIYINEFTSKKTIIMSNGVENNEKNYLHNINHYKLKSIDKDINIGFLGRFDIFIKGLDNLLDAYVDFQKLRREIKINLIFIGSHSKNKEFNSIKYFTNLKNKLVKPERFIIKGPYYGERKWEELSKLDILIQPSRTEGMPNTVLEAMSMAIPCCVSEATNMSEIIINSNSGWIINGDRASISNFFIKISDENKDNFFKKGMNGMKYSQDQLSWRKTAKPNYL